MSHLRNWLSSQSEFAQALRWAMALMVLWYLAMFVIVYYGR
jgi:hypothetical protein